MKSIEEIYLNAINEEVDQQKNGKINAQWKNLLELSFGENQNELYKSMVKILNDLDNSLLEVKEKISLTKKEKEKIIVEAKKNITDNKDNFKILISVIKKSNSNKLSDFHVWFIELDEALDKLRKAVME